MKLLSGLKDKLILLILIWTLLAGSWLAYSQSLTTDEGIHVASAYLALTRGEHRFDVEHPFLFKYLTALPLLPLDLNPPPDDQKLWALGEPTYYDSWAEARLWTEEWLYTSGNDPDLIKNLARIPSVLCLVALVWLIYFTSKRWFNQKVALWAAFFASFSPVLLVHGSFTNTDIPLSLTVLLCLWWLYKYFEAPGWKLAALSGLGLGIALCTKFSAIFLLPVSLIWYIFTAKQKKLNFKQSTLYYLTALLTVWLLIWFVYFFQSPLQPFGAPATWQLDKINQWFTTVHSSLTQVVNVFRFFLPSAFLKGLSFTITGSLTGRDTYIWGHTYGSGIWFYFPSLVLFKTQLVQLLLLLGGGVVAGFQLKKWRQFEPITWLLLISSIILIYLSLSSKLNLGIRHLSSLYPILMLVLGLLTVKFFEKIPRRFGRIGFVSAIVLGTSLPVFWQFNQLLGFTNCLVWPKVDTWWYMGDSNLDWGQQAKQVAKTLAERYPNRPIYLNFPWSPYSVQYYALPLGVTDFRHFNEDNVLPPQIPAGAVLVITGQQLHSFEARLNGWQPDYVLGNHTFFYVKSDL